ncbi:Hypothetical predicted protein [Octopus vulgaris]|uniref:Uncharacterized protein n=1 Tax=Octopus vulgaris TaxID=6645 RepID=A0AA36BL93_OCTVU|nr:Hypothetical predicted protein [Octopus vulgaris]
MRRRFDRLNIDKFIEVKYPATILCNSLDCSTNPIDCFTLIHLPVKSLHNFSPQSQLSSVIQAFILQPFLKPYSIKMDPIGETCGISVRRYYAFTPISD